MIKNDRQTNNQQRHSSSSAFQNNAAV